MTKAQAEETEHVNKAAALAYRPFGIVSSIVGGIIAGVVFRQIWKAVDREADAPKALESDFGWGKILLAAALQGAIMATVRAAIARGGATAFERWTGEWPGE